jgi:hypothetical protein
VSQRLTAQRAAEPQEGVAQFFHTVLRDEERRLALRSLHQLNSVAKWVIDVDSIVAV